MNRHPAHSLTLTLHALARLHGLVPTYTAKFYRYPPRPHERGITLWSTTDRAEATALWRKSIGEAHGKGHVILSVTVEAAQAVSVAKAASATPRDKRQVDAFPLDGGVPAGVPGAAGDRPAVADQQPAAPAGPGLAGEGEGLHPAQLPHTTVDLTKLVR